MDDNTQIRYLCNFRVNICVTSRIEYLYNTQSESFKVKWMFMQHLGLSIYKILEVNFLNLRGYFVQHSELSIYIILELNFLKLSRYLCNIQDWVIVQYSKWIFWSWVDAYAISKIEYLCNKCSKWLSYSWVDVYAASRIEYLRNTLSEFF